MRSLIEDILHDRRRDLATLPLRAALRGLSGLYGAVTRTRTGLYGRGWLHSDSVPCRVVSIGNITAGGTGKTPVVIMTARMLREAGISVAVVSRGYGSGVNEARMVSDRDSILLPPAKAGDEPHLVAASLPGVPVAAGVRRFEAARLAWERFRPDIILLDDAFQHLPLRRDADLVTLDSSRPFGNGHLLPRGTLREHPRALGRASAVLFTRYVKDTPSEELERLVHRFRPGLPVFYSRHAPVGVRRIFDEAKTTPGSLRGKRIAALSNIADPDSFHRTLESLGAEILWRCVYPDHYRYRTGEPERIGRAAREHGAEAVILTAKDERDIPEGADFDGLEALVLEIEAVLIGDRERYLRLVAGLA